MDAKPKGLDTPAARGFIKVMSRVNVRIYRASRGRVGGSWPLGLRRSVPICLLEHRGRRTGLLRTTPLVYLRDGARIIVVASLVGLPENPQWLANVRADPDVTVQIRGQRLAVRARIADPEERARLWPELVAMYPDYENYQSWTARVIPVVVLDPR